MRYKQIGRYGCITAIVGSLLLLVLLAGYTRYLINQAEAHYPPSSFVSVEGIRLHYHRDGTGPSVVIIHGSGGKVQDFTLSPLYDLLASQYDVIVIDRPGLGYSEHPAEDATPAVQARLIHGALQALDVSRPVIIGQSWGGVIGLNYALDYPDDLAGLMLLGSSPYPTEKHQETPIDTLIRQPVIGDIVLNTIYVPIGRHFVAPAELGSARVLEYFAPIDAVPENFYDATLELVVRPSHAEATARDIALIPPTLDELSKNLNRVTVPVFIIAGELDDHAESVPRLEQDLPLTRSRIIQNANHYLWFPYPEDVLEAVGELWQWTDEIAAAQ